MTYRKILSIDELTKNAIFQLRAKLEELYINNSTTTDYAKVSHIIATYDGIEFPIFQLSHMHHNPSQGIVGPKSIGVYVWNGNFKKVLELPQEFIIIKEDPPYGLSASYHATFCVDYNMMKNLPDTSKLMPIKYTLEAEVYRTNYSRALDDDKHIVLLSKSKCNEEIYFIDMNNT